MYERHNQPLISRNVFARRVALHTLLAIGLLSLSLGIGVLGYRGFEKLSWLDSLLNAAMLLGGMGEVSPLMTVGGKLFASFYSLFSGIVFLVVAGVLVAPVAHRILHRMHLEK
jgi:hypothetical protein